MSFFGETARIGGLSGLAKGYEQYRESLTFLRPTTEYGEASSDDLSSEWESSDIENNNNILCKSNHLIDEKEKSLPNTSSSGEKSRKRAVAIEHDKKSGNQHLPQQQQRKTRVKQDKDRSHQ